jgi:hypothetical protein
MELKKIMGQVGSIKQKACALEAYCDLRVVSITKVRLFLTLFTMYMLNICMLVN